MHIFNIYCILLNILGIKYSKYFNIIFSFIYDKIYIKNI